MGGRQICMLQYHLLVHCIVRKQAEVVYRTGKQTVDIAKQYKTKLIKISIH